MKFKDYYEVLGVKRTDNADEIQKAFRKLARKYHPDVNKGKDAETKFKEINEAYEVLKDQEKRTKYDSLGANWNSGQDFRPPPGFEGQFGQHQFRQASGAESFSFGGAGFSDFFESLFGQQGGFHSYGGDFGNAQASQQRRRDDEAEISVPLDVAIKGGARTINLSSGSTSKSLKVKIPALLVPGLRIRLAGQGRNGDLLLRINVDSDSKYKVQGSDLNLSLLLSPWEAALGAKIDVELPDGSVKLNIPAGSQSGSKLRIRERGLGKQGGGRGDALVEISVAVPKELSPKEKELFQELSNISTFNARQ